MNEPTKTIGSVKDVQILPRSRYRCNRCGRMPIPTSECATCLRTLLEESSVELFRHRAPDLIHTRIGIKFDWKDRLRLLFHGEARVEITTQTQFRPGLVESTSQASVRPLIQRKGGPMQLAAEAKP